MILLTDTNQALEVVTTTGEDVDYVVSYVTLGVAIFLPGSGSGVITTATTTVIVPEPAASQQIQVKQVSLTNIGTGQQTVTVRKTGAATRNLTPPVLLNPGESLQFLDGFGWRVHDQLGRAREEGEETNGFSSLLFPPWMWATAAGTLTLGTGGVTHVQYMGRAPYPLEGSAVSARINVTTAAASITWAEAALLKGPIAPAANPDLVVVGFADVSSIINTPTGLKDISINVTEPVEYGEDIWLGFGNQATTSAAIRAGNTTDDLGLSTRASRTTRPSLVVGTSENYTALSSATIWVGLFF